jgi:uncharacterized repeat protein (TIGR03843 family)
MTSLVEKATILSALQAGAIDLQGQFMFGSNYTFFAQLVHESSTFPVVYKPLKGERPLWDFPANTLGKREVAAFVVSEALGWELVPPVVFRKKGPLGPGSLQLFIEHDPDYHYFHFSEEDHQRLRPAALFDLVINNADRKGGHILAGSDGHLWLIDHGICFHAENKLRTVVWDFRGESIPASLAADLEGFLKTLALKTELYKQLRSLLRVVEISAMIQRTELLLAEGIFPGPTSRFNFPYPPV